MISFVLVIFRSPTTSAVILQSRRIDWMRCKRWIAKAVGIKSPSLHLWVAARRPLERLESTRDDETNSASGYFSLKNISILQTFLYTWFMPLVSTIMCLFIIRFYKNDVQKANHIDHDAEEESKPLIDGKQNYDWEFLNCHKDCKLFVQHWLKQSHAIKSFETDHGPTFLKET